MAESASEIIVFFWGEEICLWSYKILLFSWGFKIIDTEFMFYLLRKDFLLELYELTMGRKCYFLFETDELFGSMVELLGVYYFVSFFFDSLLPFLWGLCFLWVYYLMGWNSKLDYFSGEDF